MGSWETQVGQEDSPGFPVSADRMGSWGKRGTPAWDKRILVLSTTGVARRLQGRRANTSTFFGAQGMAASACRTGWPQVCKPQRTGFSESLQSGYLLPLSSHPVLEAVQTGQWCEQKGGRGYLSWGRNWPSEYTFSSNSLRGDGMGTSGELGNSPPSLEGFSCQV